MTTDGMVPTYVLEDGPPAMGVREYSQRLTTTWRELLESNPNEAAVHTFLERHPMLVPGAFSFPPSGSWPVRAALITKPPLQSVTRRVPDFMWLAADSATLYPVLIEIETPSKQWFNRKSAPTQQFAQAVSQLREWRAWFNEPNNQAVFLRQFDIPDDFNRGGFRPQYVLIYGRRREFEETPHLRRLRSAHENDDERFLTFDRLTPIPGQEFFISIRRRPRWYEAVAFPPTFTNGPTHARHWIDIRNRDRAIRACEWMSEDRKAFLISRLDYWDRWVEGEHGGINMADEE